MQTIGVVGGGSIDKLLESIGRERTKSKVMAVYVVNGGTGYKIWASIKDEQDFDMYLPTIQKLVDSIQIQGVKGNPVKNEICYRH